MAMIKRFIRNEGALIIEPILRTREELFSQTVAAAYRRRKATAIINANFYDLSKSGMMDAFAGNDPVEASATTPLGLVVWNGKVIAGKAEPANFYIAFYGDRFGGEGDLGAAFRSGQGNPPADAQCAFGGLGPIVINGLPYGVTNRYKSGAPIDAVKVGEPSGEAKPFLIRRSSSKYAAFMKNDSSYGGRLGKTCLGVSSNEVLIYVQQHGEDGLTLDQVRDEFVRYKCHHGVFFDGSDSAMLFADGKFLASQGENKDETCIIGAAFYWHPPAPPPVKKAPSPKKR